MNWINKFLTVFIALIFVLLLTYWQNVKQEIDWFFSGSIEDIRNRTIILSALLGLALIAWRTISVDRSSRAAAKQVILTRKGNLTDRFVKAVDLIGSSSISTVVGGIFALEQIALEEPKTYHNVVMEILTGFIRENASITYEDLKKRKKDAGSGAERPEIRNDIQAAITVIGRRKNIELENSRKWYLWKTNLERMNFENGNFDNFNFYSCNLIAARMDGVSLKNAILISTVLIEARLNNAILNSTILQDTVFSHAHFGNAKIKNTDLRNIIGYDQRFFSDADLDEESSKSLTNN